MKSLIIGSRGSTLALWQANHIKTLIESNTDLHCQIKVISTRGDRDQSTPLPEVGGKGFFTEEIESELKAHTIDLAVHSMKDLPTDLGDDFKIGAVPKRFSPKDVMVSNKVMDFENLPENATIATGSLRRGLQLKSLREDIKIIDVRGNIDTRIRKLKENKWDGLIMAEAAIERLNLNVPYYSFSKDQMIPSAAQGALAVEISSNRNDLSYILEKINHNPSHTAVSIEREIIDALDGGCKTPVGCLASIENEILKIDAFLSDINGSQFIRISDSGQLREKLKITEHVITSFTEKGAKTIVDANRKALGNA